MADDTKPPEQAKKAEEAKKPDEAKKSEQGKKRIRIVKAGVYRRDSDGVTTYFDPAQSNLTGDDAEPGVYELSEEDANHWFVAGLSSSPPPPDEEKATSVEAIQRAAAHQAVVRRQLAQANEEEARAITEIRTRRAAVPQLPQGDALAAPAATGGIPPAIPPSPAGPGRAPRANPSGDPNDHDAPRPGQTN